MLLSLHVKNLAIIDEVEVFFSDHLNILTGETGAGKSIIIGSINIALGQKVSADMIRKGADYALVELIFQPEDEITANKLRSMDLPMEDETIIISRKIKNGRSVSKVNGENVTTAQLKEIAGILIDIHGQHEHQSLLYKSRHLEIVDRYAGEELAIYKTQLENAYEEYRKIKEQLSNTIVPEEERLRELSFMEYELNEIQGARIIEGEDDELARRYKILSNAGSLMEGMSGVYEITEGDRNSVSEGIGRAIRILNKLTGYDEKIDAFTEQLADIEGYVNDFNREIAGYISDLNYDSSELSEVETRLNLLNGLKAKYGNTLYEVKNYYEDIKVKLERYRDYEAYVEELRGKLSVKEEILKDLSDKVSLIRRTKADKLSEKIKEALIDLNFLDVRFEIQFKNLNRYTEKGWDEAEFIISTNPGEEMKPLSKVASGGELSRIMLAIKSVLAENDAIETLIFDEIDVGVSGRTAQKVSEKLSVISRNHQVICITHLPQIAAMADEHFIIEKYSDQASTCTTIRALNENDSINELARILGGAKITDSVIVSAKEMKELAANTKIY